MMVISCNLKEADLVMLFLMMSLYSLYQRVSVLNMVETALYSFVREESAELLISGMINLHIVPRFPEQVDMEFIKSCFPNDRYGFFCTLCSTKFLISFQSM